MSAPDGWEEFDLIDRLLRPLAEGSPEALGLKDDAALLPSRPGHDLVVTKDALVEGVHFLADDPLDLVARKLLRVNLSDLAAKGAEPYGYLLAMALPAGLNAKACVAFTRGLAEDQATFGLKLFGGDTVRTPGPLTLSVTMLGWVEAGGMIRRNGAKPGDRLFVSGPIGDGGLGLLAAQGRLSASEDHLSYLADRYRSPRPRLDLREALKRTHAAADVSDGLIADAGHIASASGVGMTIQLDRLPLSAAAAAWLARQPDRKAGFIALATAGDDYEIVCAASEADLPLTCIGHVVAGAGVSAYLDDEPVDVASPGYRHGKDR